MTCPHKQNLETFIKLVIIFNEVSTRSHEKTFKCHSNKDKHTLEGSMFCNETEQGTDLQTDKGIEEDLTELLTSVSLEPMVNYIYYQQ